MWLLFLREENMSLFEKIVLPIGTKPKSGWIKWYHSGIPDEEGEKRKQAQDDAKILKHCENCTALSGCYFSAKNMPLYPLHPHCDCLVFSISKQISKVVATCALEKFTDYIFGEKYQNNGKTRLFKELGFTVKDSNYLKSELERQAKQKYLNGDYILGHLNKYGQRITIDIKMKSPLKNDIILKTGWMIRTLGCLTCNTPLGDR